MDFEQRVVIVTGVGHGIGYAISQAFLARKAYVIGIDTNATTGREWEKKMRTLNYQSFFICADVSVESDVQQIVKTTLDRYGRIDMLINNAGIGHTASLFDRTMEEFDRVMNVNVRAPYMLAKYCGHALQLANPGVIINIASTRALMSEANTEPYSASKGGLLALTHALAISLGPHIRVNAISPGWIEVNEFAEHSEQDNVQHPVGRVGTPDDIAQACLFLASPQAGFITGQNFIIDGGMTVKMIYQEEQ